MIDDNKKMLLAWSRARRTPIALINKLMVIDLLHCDCLCTCTISLLNCLDGKVQSEKIKMSISSFINFHITIYFLSALPCPQGTASESLNDYLLIIMEQLSCSLSLPLDRESSQSDEALNVRKNEADRRP